MKESSIVGDLINFRGLVYSPVNENGVVFLFGKVVEDLNMYIEEIKIGFPDCIGRRFTGKGWERVAIEFEYQSHNFFEHGHNPHDCDIIVCWENNWPDCPLEVIELRDVIRSLPNESIERPDTKISRGEFTLEAHFKEFPKKVETLFCDLDEKVKGISDEIWYKVTATGATFYSPERVFIYVHFQKQGLRLTIFTRGEKLDGVKGFKKGGAKWGKIHLKDEKDLDRAFLTLVKSYEFIKGTIKDNEPTGWYAELDEEEEDNLA